MKLEKLAQDWFAAWQAANPDSRRTAQSYRGLLDRAILPRLGKYELAELTTAKLRRYFAGLVGGAHPICSAGVAKNVYKLLRTILNRAVEQGCMEQNPCTPEVLGKEILAKRKAGPHGLPPVFTPEEQERLLAVCEAGLWGNLIRFAFATGLPQGELLALRAEDVDRAGDRLSVRCRVGRVAGGPEGGPKTRLALLPVEPYAIPLPASCRKIVEAQLQTLSRLQAVDARCNPEHLLFATPDGRPLEANVLRTQLTAREHRAEVNLLPFSAIRETAIRRFLDTGASDAELMQRFHIRDHQAFVRKYRPK